jgi:enoyl-CoA hydratase/carnithine racemase
MSQPQGGEMFDVTLHGPQVLVTLHRAPVNAINEAWIEQLHGVLDRYEAHAEARVLRFRSSLKIFSAGADIGFLIERLSTPEGIAAMLATVRRMQEVFDRIERSPLVSIAEIGGAALGGGFELALACDLRVVAASAKVGLPEARLSLLPGAGGSQRLTRLVGAGLSRRLILGAEVLEAAEAARLGLVHWAVPDASLAAFTDELAGRIGALPKHTLDANKRCILAAQERDAEGSKLEVEMTRMLYEHPESLKRLRAFVAARAKR